MAEGTSVPEGIEITPNGKYAISWHNMVDSSIRLGQLVEERCRETGERYDRLAMVGRGGWFTGNVLSRVLGFGALECYNMAIKTRDDEQPADDAETAQMPTAEEIAGHRWIVADEVWDSGKTGVLARDYFLDNGAVEVLSAVNVLKREKALAETGSLPDIADIEVDDRWVVFPWEPLEALGKLSIVRDLETISHITASNGQVQ